MKGSFAELLKNTFARLKGSVGENETSWFGNDFSNTWKVQLDFLLLGKRWYITRDPFQELWKYKVT